MSTGTQNVSQDATTINGLLRNLVELVNVKDSRTAYLASAAIEQLTRLRAEGSMAGFEHWDLMQKAPLNHANLTASYRGFMAILKELVEALGGSRLWPLPGSTQNAAAQIAAAWEALKESA